MRLWSDRDLRFREKDEAVAVRQFPGRAASARWTFTVNAFSVFR
jgi:hypothetical protein